MIGKIRMMHVGLITRKSRKMMLSTTTIIFGKFGKPKKENSDEVSIMIIYLHIVRNPICLLVVL